MKRPGKKLPANSLGRCKIDGCGKRAVAFHLCSAHYSKLNKFGDPLAGRTNDGGLCRVEDCGREKKARSLCTMHYERVKKHGDPCVSKPPPRGCSIDGCNDVHKAHGLCSFHYGRSRAHGDPLGGRQRRIRRYEMGQCKVDGCNRKAKSLHLCGNHFAKLKKHGDPLGGYVQDGRSKQWHVRKGGYIMKFDRSNPYANKISGIVLQHSAVMGEALGRPLRNGETVHHKNGNRSDNRLSNLELWSKAQPAGQRVSDKVKWAREIVKEYGHLF